MSPGLFRNVSRRGMMQAVPERLAYAIYLNACMALTGHLPPHTLPCGRWAFPGDRDAALEERFWQGIEWLKFFKTAKPTLGTSPLKSSPQFCRVNPSVLSR